LPDSTTDRSCGPSGCQVDWLTSTRLEVDDDLEAFTKLATDSGWGDGLPLVPPTEERVRAHVAAADRWPDDLLAEVPPRGGRCTVEKLAVNAVMAGAPAASMPLLCAAIEAMGDPQFNLFALNTTTSSVTPAVLVNGPARHRLGIPYGPGCFGGQAGPAPPIGRAIRLVMRNVGGQVVGESSKSVFGQPARVTGMVVAEWEEQSPWPPLAERRGLPPGVSAVTVHGATGTIDIADIVADNGADLVAIIGRSLAVPGTNAFIGSHHGAEIVVCLAPPWAELIARAFPAMGDVQAALFGAASLPVDGWPGPHQRSLRANDRVDGDGVVHLVETPEHLIVVVCGGTGNLHGFALHSFGPSRAVSRTISTN
jgi:hypothetical protein